MSFRSWLAELRLYLANHLVNKVPSHALRRFFYVRVMDFRLEPGASIHLGTRFDACGGLVMGENSVINGNCRIDTRGGVTIGKNVSISEEVCILTATHDLDSSEFEGHSLPTSIGDFAFIGTRAMILPGVSLGQGSAAAAGAVVTKTVEPHSIVAGVPAREIRKRNAVLNYNCRYDRLFH